MPAYAVLVARSLDRLLASRTSSIVATDIWFYCLQDRWTRTIEATKPPYILVMHARDYWRFDSQ